METIFITLESLTSRREFLLDLATKKILIDNEREKTLTDDILKGLYNFIDQSEYGDDIIDAPTITATINLSNFKKVITSKNYYLFKIWMNKVDA